MMLVQVLVLIAMSHAAVVPLRQRAPAAAEGSIGAAELRATLGRLTAGRPEAAKVMLAAGGPAAVGWRWARLGNVLHSGAAKVLVLGGSITAGRWVESMERSYGCAFEAWLRREFPTDVEGGHRVVVGGMPGQGSCQLVRGLRNILAVHGDADLIVLEFAVNDLRDGNGKRHHKHGFGSSDSYAAEVAQCFEAVLMQLRALAPDAALVLLELTCERLKRWTAEPIHTAIASFHRVPVVSLKAGLLPWFVDKVEERNLLWRCGGCDADAARHDSCAIGAPTDIPCRPELCEIPDAMLSEWSGQAVGAAPDAFRSGPRDKDAVRDNRWRIQSRWGGINFADDVHLGCTGHALVADILAHFVTSGLLQMVDAAAGVGTSLSELYPHRPVPPACCASRNAADENELDEQFALTNWEFSCGAPFHCEPRVASVSRRLNARSGWRYERNHHGKQAWVHIPAMMAESVREDGDMVGEDVLELELRFANSSTQQRNHTIVLDYLKSYEGVNQFTVTCRPSASCREEATTLALDGLWDKPVSVSHGDVVCRTTCTQLTLVVTPASADVDTNGDMSKRRRTREKDAASGHKVVLLTLSARVDGLRDVLPLGVASGPVPFVSLFDGNKSDFRCPVRH